MTKPIALVTGGSRGIGAATCKTLARDGYHVIVHYNNSADKAQALASEINGSVIQANLKHDVEIGAMIQKISQEYDEINLLVNNAGTADCESLTELTRESFFDTLQINLWAPALITQKILPILKRGSIIFTSSVCAQRKTPDALAYAGSKAGIEIIMQSIAAELAPNIRVNAVSPGTTETDMMYKNYTAEDIQWVKDVYPMRRPCEPEDIAEMIAFLASDKAKNITGEVFTVDSGSGVR
jgi:3-oxoacyl-[acyl-carrier protein] reductase